MWPQSVPGLGGEWATLEQDEMTEKRETGSCCLTNGTVVDKGRDSLQTNWHHWPSKVPSAESWPAPEAGPPKCTFLTLLTFWGVFILIIPDDQQLGQTGHLGHLGDDAEEALHTVVGEDDGGEPLRLWRDQREEERVAHAAPLLQQDRSVGQRRC